mmetsp:Transcript_325/g.598  ORF Transcript_325/g.598 Transcript_325/m.598 type:complete len:732 (-) Transcript_325:1361-3556(-)|eukprot:CAMPEP_0182444554 /NCGR_PEP_ID=MMETSP1172-20130603/2971_1 /TAXON_ID=708627 /ORGANISM="Timspurckia oligopyrenoides, Strain CCMP3278" /LENGTH=731 /DNA_ID=CAMNT_0024640133 /DNA_START=28 /DNA_END=2223 /DNA_ORIENTATION=-
MVVVNEHTGERVGVGVDLITVGVLRATLEELDVLSDPSSTETRKMDFVLTPLAHPRFERDVFSQIDAKSWSSRNRSYSNVSGTHTPQGSGRLSAGGSDSGEVSGGLSSGGGASEPFTRADTELYTGEWMSSVLGKVSEWIRLDSIDNRVRSNSEAAFFQELSYAAHLSLKAAVVNAPIGGPSGGVANFGRCLNAALHKYPTLKIMLRVPARMPDSVPVSRVKHGDPWELWNAIRSLCGAHPNLGVALEIGSQLPPSSAFGPLGAAERWIAEPLQLLLLSTSAFQLNKHGFPVLSKPHQAFARAIFSVVPQLAICHRVPAKILENRTVYRAYHLYVDYVAHLFGKQEPPSRADTLAIPYRDVPMAPLQPLLLGSYLTTGGSGLRAGAVAAPSRGFFEAGEGDTVKWIKYEEALKRCFDDRSNASGGGAIVVVVLGAGRGGLVQAVLNAATSTGTVIDEVYALEANAYARMAIQSRRDSQGVSWKKVSVGGIDERSWKSVLLKKADFVVSELIGSFGDNELLPELLDSIRTAVKPDAIIIPSAFTSYIAPLNCQSIHQELSGGREAGAKTAKEDVGFCTFERPYVVSIYRGALLSPPQACFTFENKPGSAPSDRGHERHLSLTYTVGDSGMLHGFSGYFEAVLYKDITISTRPDAATPALITWFPFFFPLVHPLYVPRDSVCTVELWRRTSHHQIWYEWALTSPEISAIHNPMGRSSKFSFRAIAPNRPPITN